MAESSDPSRQEQVEAYTRAVRALPARIRRAIDFSRESFLPLHQGEDGSISLRTAPDVARRTLGLAVAASAAVDDLVLRPKYAGWLKERGLWETATPQERKLLLSKNQADELARDISWHTECVLVLSWALGVVPKLGAPLEKCSLDDLLMNLPQGIEEVKAFIAGARLRPAVEILAALAIVLQIRSAIVENARKGGTTTSIGRFKLIGLNPRARAPGGLNAEVALEWHRALNWIACYCNEDWDDVSTDT